MYLLAVLKVYNQNMDKQRSEMECGIMGVVDLQRLCQW